MKKKIEIIRTFPDAILKIKTKNVKEISDSVVKILEQMVEVIKMVEGAGLAANQIGIDKSFAIALLENGKFLRIINPIIKEYDGEEIDTEGCLSIPDAVVKVSRATRIVIEYLDIDENIKTFEASGFTARVLQHEIDHLKGTLIIDKLKPDERLKFLREYKK